MNGASTAPLVPPNLPLVGPILGLRITLATLVLIKGILPNVDAMQFNDRQSESR
jgi:hypothetical protein